MTVNLMSWRPLSGLVGRCNAGCARSGVPGAAKDLVDPAEKLLFHAGPRKLTARNRSPRARRAPRIGSMLLCWTSTFSAFTFNIKKEWLVSKSRDVDVLRKERQLHFRLAEPCSRRVPMSLQLLSKSSNIGRISSRATFSAGAVAASRSAGGPCLTREKFLSLLFVVAE